MASLLTHAVVAGALAQGAPRRYRDDPRFLYLAALCAVIPDADVVGFPLGVDYGDLWGHRGLTHSLAFALALGLLAAARLRPDWRREGWRLAALLSLTAASHGLLDAPTNGGLGVAFFSPWDTTRYFFPWRPIEVSPIGLRGFVSERGLRVLASELKWVWLPALCLGGLLRRLGRNAKGAS